MAIIVNDRVRELTSTTGTGSVTLSGAPSGFQTFNAGIGVNNQTYYTIADAATGAWEVGIGTLTDATTLARTQVLRSSNANALVNFGSGSKDVFVTYPADMSVSQADTGTAPNQIPLNQYLGSMAYEDNDSVNIVSGQISTITNNPTFSAGTANGVAYLNASKVLTTGSALTFDGTNFGIGTNSPSSYLAGVPGLAIRGQYAGISLSESTSNTYWLNYNDQGNLLWYRNAVGEVMRLTSTGLGIGTSSPGSKLAITYPDGQRVTALTLTQVGQKVFKIEGQWGGADVGGSGGVLQYVDSGALGFRVGTSGIANLLLDSSGNLGLGVTPSAWATYKALQTGWSALAGYAGADTAVFSNAFFDGGYKYIGNGFASQYRQINSAHQWFTAPSGTAGDPITFTQAMTLDASGNLLVGTTSALKTGNIKGTGLALVGSSQNTGNELFFYRADNLVMGYIGWETPGSANSPFLFDSVNGNPIVWAISTTERMRIDSSGNVGIGTTGISNGKLTVLAGTSASGNSLFLQNSDGTYNPYLQVQHSSAGVKLYASSSAGGNASALTLSSAGVDTVTVLGSNVGIGTSSPVNSASTTALTIYNATAAALYLQNSTSGTTSSDGATIQFVDSDLTITNRESGYVRFNTANTERMRIDSSGNVRVGTAALATTATDGFLYIPTCAGTPTGTPTVVTGLAPMVIDSTNNKLYIYSGGAWVALN